MECLRIWDLWTKFKPVSITVSFSLSFCLHSTGTHGLSNKKFIYFSTIHLPRIFFGIEKYYHREVLVWVCVTQIC